VYYIFVVLSTTEYFVHSCITEFGVCMLSWLALSAVWSQPCPCSRKRHASASNSASGSEHGAKHGCILVNCLSVLCVFQHAQAMRETSAMVPASPMRKRAAGAVKGAIKFGASVRKSTVIKVGRHLRVGCYLTCTECLQTKL
jgi:hypothetical protein